MKTITVIAVILAGTFVCVAQAAAQVPESDTQSWNEVQLTIPLNKKIDFLVQGSVRVGDNISEVVDTRWGAGFNYKAHKYITLGVSYFVRDARAPNGRPEREVRGTMGATLQNTFGKFTVSDRNGVEKRWRAPQADSWRYRNRVRVEHPFTINKTKFNWFISDEIFYDFSVNDWVRNRASIGANHAFNKHFTGELYYLRQNDGRSRPGDIHVIGTLLRFKL